MSQGTRWGSVATKLPRADRVHAHRRAGRRPRRRSGETTFTTPLARGVRVAARRQPTSGVTVLENDDRTRALAHNLTATCFEDVNVRSDDCRHACHKRRLRGSVSDCLSVTKWSRLRSDRARPRRAEAPPQSPATTRLDALGRRDVGRASQTRFADRCLRRPRRGRAQGRKNERPSSPHGRIAVAKERPHSEPPRQTSEIFPSSLTAQSFVALIVQARAGIMTDGPIARQPLRPRTSSTSTPSPAVDVPPVRACRDR